MSTRSSLPAEELIRTLYYTGHYQKCVNEFGSVFQWDNASQAEIKSPQWFLYCLSLITLGKHAFLMKQIEQKLKKNANGDPPDEVLAIVRLCRKRQIQQSTSDNQGAEDLSEDKENLNCWQLRWTSAVLQFRGLPSSSLEEEICDESDGDDDFNRSLKVLHPVKDQPDCRLLRIQILLQINRSDLVESEEDVPSEHVDIVNQLGSAMFFCQTGQFHRALKIYSDLADRYSHSCLLLNNQAVCLRGLNQKQKALELLRQASELHSNDADVLWNLMVTSIDEADTGSTDDFLTNQIEEIRSINSDHNLLVDYDAREKEIVNVCEKLNIAIGLSNKSI